MTSGWIALKLYRFQLLFLLVILLMVSFTVLLFGNSWTGVNSKRNGFSGPTERGVNYQLNRKVAGGYGRHRKLKTEISKMVIRECSWDCSISNSAVPVHAPSAGPHSDCKANRDLQIHTAQSNFTVSNVPKFVVTVYNTCTTCSIRNVRVECGQFASAVLPDPCLFRRCAINECLIQNGSPIPAMDSVTFSYANSFEYPLKLKPVSDNDVLCPTMTAARVQ